MFEYPFMNDVMRIVKEEEPEILNHRMTWIVV